METRGDKSLRMVFSRPDGWTIDSVEFMGLGGRKAPEVVSYEEFSDAVAAARRCADTMLIAQ